MAGGEEEENMETREQAGAESSDDDIEIVPKSVDNYWLEYGDETPVSFASLPYFKLGEDPTPDKIVFVRGTQDNGMRLYMRAVSWKLELTKDVKPAFHLKTEKYWIQLRKPRKSYEETIRSVMSVAQFLNFALVNPDASEKAVWTHVNDVFPSWELSASRNDLSSHAVVFRHLVASDERLAAASALQTLDTGASKKRLASATEDGRQSSKKGMSVPGDEGDGGIEVELQPEQKRGKFELDDLNPEEEMDGYGEEADGEEVSDLSETVCCICDNGGTVICCDGRCMRSFHLNKGAGGAEDSHCSTLGFSKAEAERMEKFFCPNCKFNKHQCYICGKLGLSDEAAGAAQEVFVCDAAMCGHFYHPACVAALILRDKDISEQEALAASIKDKQGFVCTMHKCWECGKGEDNKIRDLQFGVCRRCPRVWHRKCLPFSPPPLEDSENDSENEDDSENENDEPQRAWDGLLPNRILVYCTRHTINPDLGTPARNHVKFPEGSLPSAKKVIKRQPEGQERKSKLIKLSSKKDTDSLKRGVAQKISKLDGTKKAKRTLSLEQGKVATKSKLDRDGTAVRVSTSKAIEKSSGPFLIKGRADIAKQDGSSSKPLSLSKGRLDTDVKLERSGSTVIKPLTPRESAKSKPPLVKAVVIDNQTRNMVNGIIERSKALVTIESVLKKHDIPICYRRNSRNPDKKYSLFKIESITKGMRKALETLETGGNIEDAKVKCSPDLIRFIEVCRNDLRVYLSPFLHGARYTSYGRHFTKAEKLEEIVDRLHWFVEKGDMVVDFCCGANEFSLFLRRKLEETGKKCDYKNFDLIQTKNEFSFQKRDWFQVTPDELPDGNRLIMGLNPPFGVKGHLANQFIDHALKFKPKLVILIVPKETERLDQKPSRYDLVWEDPDLLAGQSFYLPGSVDVDEKPLNDWNVVAPPLYLWSRPDWTSRHREIAADQGHISAVSSSRYAGNPWKPAPRPYSPSLLLDTVVEDVEIQMESIELVEKEEKKINSFKPVVQPKTVDEPSGVLETRPPKLDRSSSAKSKDSDKKSRELTDSRPADGSSSKVEGRVKDNILSKLKAKTSPPKLVRKDGPVPEKRQEEKHLDPLKKPSEGSQKNQNISKIVKTGELQKRKSFEGQDHLHAQRSEKLKSSSQEAPDVTRHISEPRHDTSRKDRKPNERFDRGDDARTEPSRDVQWKRAPEKHRLSAEADMGGRRSPSRNDKYEPSRRKSPDKYDRYGSTRHGEDRKASPERSRHGSMANEPRRGSPDKPRYSSSAVDHELRRVSPDKPRYGSFAVDHALRRVSPDKTRYSSSLVDHELRRGSPDKSRYSSSVVDLDTLFSSSDVKKDQSRGYDDHTRKSYPDSSYYRESSPSRRYVSEDSKRSWVNMDGYQGVSETQLRTNDASYMTNSYESMAQYQVPHVEAQMNPLGRHYSDHEPLSIHRQDAYGVQMPRQTDFYPQDRLRGMQGLPNAGYRDDRYGVPSRTEDSFRAGFGGGVGALPERSYQSTWAGAMPGPGAYSAAYGSQQPLVDSSLLSSHSLIDSRLAQGQSNRPPYPPSHGRLSGQGHQQFAGGWFDD